MEGKEGIIGAKGRDGGGSFSANAQGVERQCEEPRRETMEADGISGVEVRPASLAHAAAPTQGTDIRVYVIGDQSSHDHNVNRLLSAAWSESPNAALKLIFHLTNIMGTKGERAIFIDCLHWLRINHPRTLLANLKHVAALGHWEDILTLVVRECVGENTYRRLYRESASPRFQKAQSIANEQKVAERAKERRKPLKGTRRPESNQREKEAMGIRSVHMKVPRQENRKATSKCLNPSVMTHAKVAFLMDTTYQAIHVEVARLFALALKQDLYNLENGRPLSAAAKWAPAPENHHDRYTLIASTISQVLYPKSTHQREGESYETYAWTVREKYRREYLLPLQASLGACETDASSDGGEEGLNGEPARLNEVGD